MEAIAHGGLPEEAVWLEVLSRHRGVIARYRLTDSLMVGRAYDNDVILDDPYVAPRHLRVVRDKAGVWMAEDLGSANGLFPGHGKQRQPRLALADDGIVRIGQTYLRLRHASYAVPPERVLRHNSRTLCVALALGGLYLALMALSLWLTETGEPKVSRYLVPLLVVPLVVLAWTGIWSIFARIFSGQARFESQLLIAASAMLAWWVIERGGEFLVYAASWPAIAAYDYVAVWLLAAATVFSSLWVIGPTHLRLKGGVVAALMIVGIVIQSADLFDGRDWTNRQETHLLPPAFRLVPVQANAAFFADVERLKGELDRDRQRKPRDSGGEFVDDDDG